ncbi:MAG: ATP synthase subunit I [Acidimicrobiales bacterium]
MADHIGAFPAAVSASAPEREIAHDMVRRGLVVGPALVAASAAVWGWTGVWSSLYAVVLVLANFLLGAAVITWAARTSPAVMFGAVMFGYIARLGVITVAVLPVRHSNWFEVVPFAATLLIAHLGLLAWETRHVATSLAFPGLRPGSAFMSSSESQERAE